MLDPQGIYDVNEAAVERTPGLGAPGSADGPVLLYAVRGFVDAGSTGGLAVEHLLSQFHTERLVTFDMDQLLDYRSKRATMTFDTDRWSDYEAPHLVIDHLIDTEGTSFLLLHGTEPDLQWERVIAGLIQLMERFGVSLAVSMQGIPMGVPHTRPLSLTAHSTRAGLVDDYTSWFGSVQVPGSLSSLFEYRLGETGYDALGFTVHVPHYLAQSQYPPATIVALHHAELATGLDLSVLALEEAATDAKIQVEKQVEESTEVASLVRALEEQYDAFTESVGRPSLLAESTRIPSAEEIGAEFERFLAQRNGD